MMSEFCKSLIFDAVCGECGCMSCFGDKCAFDRNAVTNNFNF